MATGLLTADANSILDTWAAATPKYIKLHVGDPGVAGASNAAGNTVRKLISWAAATGGVVSSNANVDWTNVSTTETPSHFSLWDAVSGGNFKGSGTLPSPRAVGAGDNYQLPSGDIDISLNVAS